MPCKKENCKCFKCGKIADKEVDTQLLSNSSTSELKAELVPDSRSKSSLVVYKQEPEIREISTNEKSSAHSIHSRTKPTQYGIEPFLIREEEPNKENLSNKSNSVFADSKNKLSNISLSSKQNNADEILKSDWLNEGKNDLNKIESKNVIDENTHLNQLSHISPDLEKEKKVISKEASKEVTIPLNDFLIPPVCSNNNQIHYTREDMDKPLHPPQHNEISGDLPIILNEFEDNISFDRESSGSAKNDLKNMNELRAALQVIVDSSNKILNTIDKVVKNPENNIQPDSNNKKHKDNVSIFNVHSIQLNSQNAATINFSLNLNLRDNEIITVCPLVPNEGKERCRKDNVKTSSESVNIHYPKTPYKSLSSEFVITENVLVNGYADVNPQLTIGSEAVKLTDSHDISPNSISEPDIQQTNVLHHNKGDLKLPVNFPQQRDISVCVPCYCDTCPLFDNDGNLICPEQCGCCTCAYTINESNPEDRTELELCRCTSKTQFNTIGRSHVSRCQCSRRVDLCPCRDKYGSLGEKVAEFDNDTLRNIKKRKSTHKSTLRTSRLQFTDDYADIAKFKSTNSRTTDNHKHD